jgi:metallopeptidase MepB
MTQENHRRPPQAPPSFTATPESLMVDVKKLIEKTRGIMDKVVEEVRPEAATFDNVVLPIALDKNDSSLSENIISFYRHVSTDKNLRDGSAEAEKIMDEFNIEMSMQDDIYKLVESVF